MAAAASALHGRTLADVKHVEARGMLVASMDVAMVSGWLVVCMGHWSVAVLPYRPPATEWNRTE